MREIKFRGKTLSGKWIYGYLSEVRTRILNTEYISKVIFENLTTFNTDNFHFVVRDCEVSQESIGQYTGMKDKNGKEIYEGDVVLQQGYHGNKEPMIVRFESGVFIVGYHDGSSTNRRPMLLNKKSEVIGNIYDNPELLED